MLLALLRLTGHNFSSGHLSLLLRGPGSELLTGCGLNHSNAENRALELLCNPGVEALARKHSRNIHLPVQVWRNSSDELSGKRLVRGFAACFAELKVIIHGLVKCLLNLGNAVALKGDDVAGVDDFPVKNLRLVVELDFADITFFPTLSCVWRARRV